MSTEKRKRVQRRRQRCSSCFISFSAPAQCPLHLWWHTIEVWDLALLRRWLDISNKMANARTQGFSVTSDIFQVELISQRPPILVLGIFSLYWDCNILFMYGHNTTTSLLLFSRGWDQQGTELLLRIHQQQQHWYYFCLWQRGLPMSGQQPHFHRWEVSEKQKTLFFENWVEVVVLQKPRYLPFHNSQSPVEPIIVKSTK